MPFDEYRAAEQALAEYRAAAAVSHRKAEDRATNVILAAMGCVSVVIVAGLLGVVLLVWKAVLA
jgi:hypothetical protein